MKVLVVGKGGREHALVHGLWQSGAEVLATQPNPGMAQHARALAVAPTDVAGILAAAQAEHVDLVVIGPEAPLVLGLADVLRAHGFAVFGPGQAPAQLEASKDFTKKFLIRHGIPTARHVTVTDLTTARAALRTFATPPVIKADGLAAGKGVVVPDTWAEAEAAVQAFLGDRTLGEAGAKLVLEERLVGPEISALALCDGKTLLPLDLARDHKRILDGDRGDNTGGMGAVSPLPNVDAATRGRIDAEVLQPTLAGLLADGMEFRGVIYAGIMLTADGPKVLEYNVRFGDPEAQVLIPRLGARLADLLLAAATGQLAGQTLPHDVPAAVTVVLAAAGYPGTPRTGDVIHGLAAAAALPDVLVYHAGTQADGATVRTAGGRVLAVTGLGATVAQARARAYAGAAEIQFDGKQLRTDIASSVL